MQHLQVQTDGVRFFISRDDHRRYCEGLLARSRPLGGDVETVMRAALQTMTPGGSDVAATAAYFGADLPIIQEIIRPLLEALGKMMPGFDVWMGVTGFGNNREFIMALVNWQRVLTKIAAAPKGRDRSRMIKDIATEFRRKRARDPGMAHVAPPPA